ncbi:hypothetical protein IMZ31_19920 (plasmid) [Pontibacillus sp. ALD_SL1]|uniref:hypothetical protein n=1 Tax=Pontibacillus sp. ALD_SL1 TaxID=2777185 RepID=UPI001A97B5F9|nr:hypothetical protein [Pontibacillus sp. ALD_SL1]QST02820.1 hypothetical protein IMZ31_19920 [Pontibacillus sp. ALD_SL1]
MIKGYVHENDRPVPITWERETAKYVYNARKVYQHNKELIRDKRLYDDKIAKKEIHLIRVDSRKQNFG